MLTRRFLQTALVFCLVTFGIGKQAAASLCECVETAHYIYIHIPDSFGGGRPLRTYHRYNTTLRQCYERIPEVIECREKT